jgi:hypothetical protein
MSYQPNFSDPRVQSRITQAVKFCEKYLRVDKSQWLSTRWIDKSFGMSTNPLSRYLRDVLLVCVNETYNKNTGQCKTYRLNESGFNKIKASIKNIQTTYSVIDLANKYHEQFKTGEFEYNDTSSRLYHPVQNCPRAAKQQLLAEQGYNWHYDIECAAPTLLHQYSQQIPEIVVDGVWKQGPMDLYLFTLRDYIRNRQAIRAQLALQCEVSEQTIKRIVNGMFQGAQISRYNKSLTYIELDGDAARIEFLKQHKFIQDLKTDIAVMWDYLKPVMSKRTKVTKTGQVRQLPISGKQKTGLYRELERRVVDVVKDYMTLRDVRYFLEHDGWATDREIDINDLCDYIRERTGFDIKIHKQHIVS